VLSDGTRVHALEDVVNVNVETFKASNSTARHCLKGWRADAIERFERADDASVRKLPAYLLGAWLGDGTMGKAALSKPMCNMVAAWIEYGRKIGYRVTEQKQEGRCPSWLLHNGRGGVSHNKVASDLKAIGVLNSRHVPDSYKYGPASVRRELLAGLIDSDGHISKGGCDWISKSQQLAEDFAFICRSLGLSCYLSRQEKGIRETGFRDHYWRASVSGDLSQLPMRDKIAAPRAQKKRHLVHGISVERIGIGDYFGFEIDGDRLFLLGDFTVTHNTYCGMRLIQQALERGKRACFVCDRITLIEQTSAVADRYGLTNHGVIQGSHWRQRLDAPFQIVSAQTMARRQWMGFDLIVVDECFPGETVVFTPSGPVRIADVKPGALVQTACGTARVKSVFAKEVAGLITVRMSDGNAFECTADHPIFTDSGWVSAGKLERGARVFGIEDVRGLWGGVQADGGDSSDFGSCIQGNEVLREILRKEVEEPDALRMRQEQGFADAEGNRPHAEDAGREWARADRGTASGGDDAWQWLGAGVHLEDEAEAIRRVSAPLQDRPRERGAEGRNRDRRREPLLPGEKGAGREERQLAAGAWVESVAPSERGGPRTVFNLRVEGHPSYFANGVLVHNCHTFSKGWVDHVQTTTASVVGLSATPFAKGMGKIFSNLVNAATMDELTRIGVLVPMRVMTCRRPDMAGAELNSKGEWSERAAEERELAIVGDVVTQWIQHAASLKTIVFGATIRHCEEMVRQFVEAGYVAATFTADTPASERQELLDGFRSGAVQILVSVEALAKGFDVPDVGCVCDARPLRKSLSTAIQMWGRGLRSSPGKSECLLLDFSGNILRFANDFESVYFDGLDKLDDGERLDREARQEPEEVEESKPCPMCGYSPFKRRCMSCGHETVTQSLAVVEAGEMREIMIGKARAASDERDLYAQLCTYTRQHGFKPGYAAVKHREITGRFPPRHWSFESMPDVPVSRVVANKIRQSLIAFRHRKSA
jgi:superfamily II DNA or RNA helicase